MSIDYDLYVIDPENKESTPEQIRDCIYDALCVLNERTRPKKLIPPKEFLAQFREKRERYERSKK